MPELKKQWIAANWLIIDKPLINNCQVFGVL
jgi:hypothetical protein